MTERIEPSERKGMMKRGDQIVYIPDHAKETGINHPDVEFGFVNSISHFNNETIFCRYWFKGVPGKLRTTANSEGTRLQDLNPYKSVADGVIEATIERIDAEATP